MSQQILTTPRADVVRPVQPPDGPPKRAWLGWVAVLGLALLVGGIVYWARSSKTSEPSPGARGRGANAVIPVVAAAAHQGDIGVYYTGLGTVTPLYTVTVRSRVDGELMSVLYKEGQTVHKGQVLAQIDARPFEVQLTQAEGQLAKDQAALANARTDLERYKTLVAQNAVPEQQYATQQALITQDEGVVKSDQGQIDQAKLNISYSRITAPIGGRVGLRLVDPGNIVHASDTNGLMVITQVQPISVIFTIAEDQLPPVLQKLRSGQRLTVDAYDREMKNKLAQGRLSTIDNQIDPSTGTLKLRATYDNKDDALFPNQFVNARLLLEERRGVILVPSDAIQRTTQTTFVYLVKPDQTVTVRPVTVGATEGNETQVVSGISPGDVVVTTGVDKLQEGSKVKASLREERNPASGS